jgi:hypothetical protein
MSRYTDEITARPADLGGGWRLRLLEDGEEMGSRVFPAPIETRPSSPHGGTSRATISGPNGATVPP